MNGSMWLGERRWWCGKACANEPDALDEGGCDAKPSADPDESGLCGSLDLRRRGRPPTGPYRFSRERKKNQAPARPARRPATREPNAMPMALPVDSPSSSVLRRVSPDGWVGRER